MRKDWHGLVKITELKHWRNGEVIQEFNNLYNILHQEGEEFILTAAFVDPSIVPTDYYLGLDNRGSVAANQTLANIFGEPIAGGYVRQTVSSTGDFTLSLDANFVAVSPVVVFQAGIGESWGPVRVLFLTNVSDLDINGYLITSVELPSSITVANGDSITIRLQLSMKDCPVS